MRRRYGNRLNDFGWCMRHPTPGEGYCSNHRHGEKTRTWARVKLLYRGDAPHLPEGYSVAGFIPGNNLSSPSGDTYFVLAPSKKDPRGVIKAVCLRHDYYWKIRVYRSSPPRPARCLRRAGQGTPRKTGPCYEHGGYSIGPGRTQIMNLLDPNYVSVFRIAKQADPRLDQLRDRIDLLRYEWYLFAASLAKRQRLIDDLEPDRTVGIQVILKAADLIIASTKLQTQEQVDSFKATAAIWAQQVYCIKQGMLLLKLAGREGEVVRRRVAVRLERAMRDKYLIDTDQRLLDEPAENKPQEEVAPGELVLQNRSTSRAEMELLEAMDEDEKRLAYQFAVTELGEKIMSLHPLVRVLDNLKVEEERAGAPMKVKLDILAMIQKARAAQMQIDKGLSVNLTERDITLIGERLVAAVVDAIGQEEPLVQAKIMYGDPDVPGYDGWQTLQAEITIPQHGYEAVGNKIIEVANAGR